MCYKYAFNITFLVNLYQLCTVSYARYNW
jgi:hypothetical protein